MTAMSTNTNSLAAEVHAALSRARTVRDSVIAASADAARALQAHLANEPAPYDEAEAAQALAQAQFRDRVHGSGEAEQLQTNQAEARADHSRLVGTFRVERARLEGDVSRLQAEAVAADATIAELIATRTAVVARAGRDRLAVERERYRVHVLGLVAAAQSIVALQTIVTEPERPANQARRFDAFSLALPALGAFTEVDVEAAALGAQAQGGTVRLAEEASTERARQAFKTITDEICGVTA